MTALVQGLLAALAVPVLLSAPDAGSPDAAVSSAAPPDAGARPSDEFHPAAALAELRPLLGAWSCAGKSRSAPGAPELPTRSTWKFAETLDGFWMSVRFEQERSAANPHPVWASGVFGYDDEGDRFVGQLALNDGSFEQLGSPGWEGDRFNFHGQYRLGDDRLSFRRSFERGSGKQSGRLRVTLELQLVASGDWTIIADELCSR